MATMTMTWRMRHFKKIPSDAEGSDEEEMAPAEPQEEISGLNLKSPMVQLMMSMQENQELQCTKGDMERLEKRLLKTL